MTRRLESGAGKIHSERVTTPLSNITSTDRALIGELSFTSDGAFRTSVRNIVWHAIGDGTH